MKNYQEYTEKMIADGRFATISEDGKIVLMMTFSVCNDPRRYLDNTEHEFIEHNPDGNTLVIEDMVCGKFKFRYVSVIEDIFCNRYPNLERFMWRRYRKSGDRIYSIGRRHSYEV